MFGHKGQHREKGASTAKRADKGKRQPKVQAKRAEGTVYKSKSRGIFGFLKKK